MHIYETIKEQHLSIGGTELSDVMNDENGYNEHIDGNHKLLRTLFVCLLSNYWELLSALRIPVAQLRHTEEWWTRKCSEGT